ncbi:unnamed protein product [Miscanthus lutarioriparius]|uniref:Uncharacterized protein n=1 Tax=Miscanthus lutarioriparius TaxID=422564 RepID=A0A811MWF7_9POAL|nr:unnamed protein product [Miscanthus lutarioriparius]
MERSAIALALASIDFCIRATDVASASSEALRSSPMVPAQDATDDVGEGGVMAAAAGGGLGFAAAGDLCEFKLAETVNLSNAELIEDVASRTGADALARLCGKVSGSFWHYRREHLDKEGECEFLEKQVAEEVKTTAS